MRSLNLISSVVLLAIVLTNVATRAAEPQSISLFNGKDLTGWTPYLRQPSERKEDTETPPSRVWQVQDDVLVCKGRPTGYLRTNGEYQDYKFKFEWRWPTDSLGGNSGVLMHVSTANALGQWPRSIEVQLFHRYAGDLWVIPSDVTLNITNIKQRKKGRRYLNLTDKSEKPIGEWNKMEVICKGDEIRVLVNGDLVNHATDCSETRGAIALQAEGAEIHFRNIVLIPQKR